jgi:hypothetical protein
MKKSLAAAFLAVLSTAAYSQQWKTLPKGVRIVGYRNVITSKIDSNFNQFGSATPLGAQFRIDAKSINNMTGNTIAPGDINSEAYNSLTVGEYKVDAQANLNVQGTGFGYGITDKLMFYGEIAYYQAHVKADIKRTAGNSYAQTAAILAKNNPNYTGSVLAENLSHLMDVSTGNIQSVVQNYYGYKPIGDWYGSGFGDMETGLMYKAIDKGTWGLQMYPGVVLPTGRKDDPDMLQDIGFGDGQFDFFQELATGYVVNDKLTFGTTLRYTYQASTNKQLRVPTASDFALSSQKGEFNVKYGDRVNWMINSTFYVNDWLAFTPVYRFMYQLPSAYKSDFTDANKYLSYNSDKQEHQVQLTTTVSSIQPFLKKQFVLPAQININLLQTVAGKNVPKAGRFEVELRMLF